MTITLEPPTITSVPKGMENSYPEFIKIVMLSANTNKFYVTPYKMYDTELKAEMTISVVISCKQEIPYEFFDEYRQKNNTDLEVKEFEFDEVRETLSNFVDAILFIDDKSEVGFNLFWVR